MDENTRQATDTAWVQTSVINNSLFKTTHTQTITLDKLLIPPVFNISHQQQSF